MPGTGTTAAGWLVHTLMGGGLLLLLGCLWAAWTRQPARRQRIAEWAAAAALVLAAVSLGPAWLVVTLAAPTPVAAQPAIADTSSKESVHTVEVAPAPPVDAGPPEAAFVSAVPLWAPPVAPAPDLAPPPVPAPLPEPARAAPPAVPAAAHSAPAEWTLDRLAFLGAAAYLTGSVLVLGRWLLGWLALRRLLRQAAPVTGRPARLLAEMTAGRPPRLLASQRARAPFSCGLLRPTVVLPAGLAALAPDDVLRWVFAHELAHLKRRDAWTGLLFGLGQAVYFGVPWFWQLRRQARLCQEYLADAAAVTAGGRPEEYAQFLLAWTAVPPAPAGACGVRGGSSDLFRRVNMLLRTPFSLEGRCPRRWWLAAACTLLSLAVLAGGLTLRAAAAPAPAPKAEEPKKDEPKPEQPKKEEPKADEPKKEEPKPGVEAPDLLPSIDELLKNLPPNLDAEQVKQMRAQMERMRKEMKKAMEEARKNGGAPVAFPPDFGPGGGVGFAPGFPGAPFRLGSPQGVRLGAAVEKPDPTLVEQLDLPKDQGLVVQEVTADSAAAKAGVKPHDILLELNGKPVANSIEDFVKQLEGIKADTAVDVVVLRKGKKETLKGLTLPEAKAAAPGLPGIAFPPGFTPPGGGFPPGGLVPPGGFTPPGGGLVPPGGGFPPAGFTPPGGANGVMTTLFRTSDHFTTRHQEGSLIITLTGKVADGKATVGEITVQDGGESSKYESADKAPEKYRDKVKNLIEMSEKGGVHVEVKTP